MNEIWMKVEEEGKPDMYIKFTIEGATWRVADLMIEREDGVNVYVKDQVRKKWEEQFGVKISYSRDELEDMDRTYAEEILKYVSYQTVYKAAIEAWKAMKPVMASLEEVDEDGTNEV
ncbi:hypothetical protein BSP38_030 [Bacillus phage BSP38]|uniref:Uncharacterized protein n=1 Tax=Bacillus phage BSP38 TaxID=2283013 RepID=A0A345MJP0_BPBSP|nr:hypothetical protein HWB82_gp030 [Bacillus phage BSP38]AXH71072.1 hypothetical protein BSP38_030 [Bacillus phage BSP38]